MGRCNCRSRVGTPLSALLGSIVCIAAYASIAAPVGSRLVAWQLRAQRSSALHDASAAMVRLLVAAQEEQHTQLRRAACPSHLPPMLAEGGVPEAARAFAAAFASAVAAAERLEAVSVATTERRVLKEVGDTAELLRATCVTVEAWRALDGAGCTEPVGDRSLPLPASGCQTAWSISVTDALWTALLGLGVGFREEVGFQLASIVTPALLHALVLQMQDALTAWQFTDAITEPSAAGAALLHSLRGNLDLWDVVTRTVPSVVHFSRDAMSATESHAVAHNASFSWLLSLIQDDVAMPDAGAVFAFPVDWEARLAALTAAQLDLLLTAGVAAPMGGLQAELVQLTRLQALLSTLHAVVALTAVVVVCSALWQRRSAAAAHTAAEETLTDTLAMMQPPVTVMQQHVALLAQELPLSLAQSAGAKVVLGGMAEALVFMRSALDSGVVAGAPTHRNAHATPTLCSGVHLRLCLPGLLAKHAVHKGLQLKLGVAASVPQQVALSLPALEGALDAAVLAAVHAAPAPPALSLQVEALQCARRLEAQPLRASGCCSPRRAVRPTTDASHTALVLTLLAAGGGALEEGRLREELRANAAQLLPPAALEVAVDGAEVACRVTLPLPGALPVQEAPFEAHITGVGLPRALPAITETGSDAEA